MAPRQDEPIKDVSVRSPRIDPAAPEAPATLWQIAWRQVRRNRLAMACLGIIVVYSCVAAYTETVYWYHRFAQTTAP